jgi:large subunit ribosomal protein L38e
VKANQKQQIKFKIRCKKYLYTLILNDGSKTDKIKQSLPPGLNVNEVGRKNKKAKKT